MNTNPKSPQDEASNNGPEGPMARLLMQHSDAVYRFCLRLCGGRAADAEDLTQDALVLAWQNRASFASRSALTTWLMRIALNRYFRLRQRVGGQAQPFPMALDEERDSEASALPSSTDRTLDRLELTDALDTLPPPLRAAFVLVKVEGLKYREAADVLGIPQGTVQYQVHDATMRLRSILSETYRGTASVSVPPHAADTPKEAVSHVL